MCRSVLSPDDKDHLRHFMPASCLERLDRRGGVTFHAQQGRQLGSAQMGFYAYCIPCDAMFSTRGEGAFGPWFGECLEQFDSSHICQGARADQVRHGFMSILTRCCMLSQPVVADMLFLPVLDQLRRYVRFSNFIQIDSIPGTTVMVHMASQRSVNGSRFPDSLVTTFYFPVPNYSDGTFAVILYLGPFILLGALGSGVVPAAAGRLITATGALAMPEISRRVALPELYTQLQQALPGLYAQMSRAVTGQPPQHRHPPAGQPPINAGQLIIHERQPPKVFLPRFMNEATARAIAGRLENQQLSEFTIVRSWEEHAWRLSLAKPTRRPTFSQQDFRLLAWRSQTAAAREVLMWLHGSALADDAVQLRWGDQHLQKMVQDEDPLPTFLDDLSVCVQPKLEGKSSNCFRKICLMCTSL